MRNFQQWLIFKVCSTFSETNGTLAAWWLCNLEQEFQIKDHFVGKVQSYELIPAIDFLLIGITLEWAKENPIILGILTKFYPPAEDVR